MIAYCPWCGEALTLESVDPLENQKFYKCYSSVICGGKLSTFIVDEDGFFVAPRTIVNKYALKPPIGRIPYGHKTRKKPPNRNT